ncbi:MAG: RlpA-like double-psi beta-barrel domain-containing protein [Solirubrobacteraceae bacterium]
MKHGSIGVVLLALAVGGCGGASGGSGAKVADQAAVTPSGAADGTPSPVQAASGRKGTGAAGRRGAPRLAHPVPAAFRATGISPGAPSDDQVRAELQQMYVAQAQAKKLSAAAANFAGLLPWVAEPKSGQMVSVASVFTDYGLGLACGGLLAVNQIGVAHKTAPCGTLIDFTYNGRTLRVPVIDRGPYIVGREWDLTGATAAALGFPGLGPITWHCASC